VPVRTFALEPEQKVGQAVTIKAFRGDADMLSFADRT